MVENHEVIGSGFRCLVKSLAPYIARELSVVYGKDWWRSGVYNKLYDDQKRDLRTFGEWAELVDSLDIARCLQVIDINWNDVFRKKLSIDHRNWVKELIGVRNKWAHAGSQDFDDAYAWRALDTMSRLCEQIDEETTEEIRSLIREVRYGSANGSTAVTNASETAVSTGSAFKSAVLTSTPMSGLPAWRNVIEPHPDVAQGRYKNAEFAADLAQVARGEGSYEYLDPVEFFARTYVTEGISGLLVQAIKRVTGKDGEPVIQLKTAFGGGKTHSMLALFHLLRGQVSLDKLPNVKIVLQKAGVSSLPRVKVAVLVGPAIDPSKSKRPNKFPGITINTLWGEMAAQLAEASNDPKLYDFVKESDKKGVSPGSEAIKNLFDACGPCLVLIDELVAYARKLYGAENLPSGTFDNLISFIQELTEAARASKNSLVVASIPESNIEIGGDAGKIALSTIEHTFGRMEAIWKPVVANEGFEIVRRRLFLDCKDTVSRDMVCHEFSKMYTDSTSDFPIECKELEYYERIKSCYPIHPEVFDRLYEDWATLERFQKTRGVLRLMAAVIHDLWMNNDNGLMIMPSSLSLDNPNIREELTRHLPEGWNSVVDSEVDGKNSIPYQVEKEQPRFARSLAARRVARTILFGSAPSVKEMQVRGIEASRIRLGVVQPGEQVAIFNDVLSRLQNSLTYLYSNPSNDRYWYDTRPTLRKTVEDRASQVAETDMEFEIEKRLSAIRGHESFSGIHTCPGSSLDVPDEQSVRLVVLRIQHTHKNNAENSKALEISDEILNNHGTSPRLYRNMIAFVAPDCDLIEHLKLEVKRYLAWQSIKRDSEDLNLDAAQNRETENNIARANGTVDLRIREAYCWLLVPYIDNASDQKTVAWEKVRISGGTDNYIVKASKKMMQNEMLITKWAPALLLMELDKLLWKNKDFIPVKQLWDFLCSYCYLPRIANYDVLANAIKDGVNSEEYFGVAEGISDERFIALKFNQYVSDIDRSYYLVKASAAKKQVQKEKEERETPPGPITGTPPLTLPTQTGGGVGIIDPPVETPPRPVEPSRPRNKRFYLSARLDNTRVNRDVSKIVEEVIQHIANLGNAELEITLEVNAHLKGEVPQSTIRTVTENCKTLKISNSGFEEE